MARLSLLENMSRKYLENIKIFDNNFYQPYGEISPRIYLSQRKDYFFCSIAIYGLPVATAAISHSKKIS